MSEAAASNNDTKIVVYTRAFLGLLQRDFRVLTREIVPFLIRIAMNPLLFLFVFTFVMPHMSGGANLSPTASMAGGGFGTVLLPGLMAVAIMFSGIGAVAIEKVVFSAIQSIFAAGVVFPLAYYIPSTPVLAHVSSWPFLIAVLILASLLAGALGLTIGTFVQPKQIGLIFGVVIMPITFLGCVYYPWAALSPIKWLQIGVLINPIVYITEGLRAALTPTIGHMPDATILAMLLFFFVLLTALGLKGFSNRVLS
jgi:ABC-2 type transport system permease protein